jgi:hypothetical protein
MFECCMLPCRLTLRQLFNLCVSIVIKLLPDMIDVTGMKVLNPLSICVLQRKFLMRGVKFVPIQEVESPRISRD